MDLVQRPAGDYGPCQPDAHHLVDQSGEAPLAGVCDTNHTRVAEIRKERLPAGDPQGGLHPSPAGGRPALPRF
ncbi:hypothetical protein [Streptomyces sp. NPDC051098]|uniref:hypothetical protein n=1 Tax=Streptomyces sp. NPDC051098 TaxID=3155411 RepID=UPI003440366F